MRHFDIKVAPRAQPNNRKTELLKFKVTLADLGTSLTVSLPTFSGFPHEDLVLWRKEYLNAVSTAQWDYQKQFAILRLALRDRAASAIPQQLLQKVITRKSLESSQATPAGSPRTPSNRRLTPKRESKKAAKVTISDEDFYMNIVESVYCNLLDMFYPESDYDLQYDKAVRIFKKEN